MVPGLVIRGRAFRLAIDYGITLVASADVLHPRREVL